MDGLERRLCAPCGVVCDVACNVVCDVACLVACDMVTATCGVRCGVGDCCAVRGRRAARVKLGKTLGRAKGYFTESPPPPPAENTPLTLTGKLYAVRVIGNCVSVLRVASAALVFMGRPVEA
jgi:hypothetical protein